MYFTLLIILSSLAIGSNDMDHGVVVETRAPLKKTIIQKATYPAEILPFRKATLAAEWVGPITEIQVHEYERVEKGQVLAQVDTALLELQIQEAKANQEFAEKQLARFQGLHQKKAVTEQALLEVERNFKIANSTLERLNIQLKKATVQAPWSGYVKKKWVAVGDYVIQGQALFELVDHSQFRVRATVSGDDTEHLKTGQKASLIFQNKTKGIDTQISRIASEMDPASRSLEVEALIANSNLTVRPGMVAYLEIQQRTLQDVLLVPLSAILQFEDGKGVYVSSEGKAQHRQVTTGDIQESYQIILDGLLPNDQVIIQGQNHVSEGSKVIESNNKGDSL